MAKDLILYSTEYCHLCEQAIEVLRACGLAFDIVDIAFDDNLMSQFGTRIPVIDKNGSRLYWPFNREDLLRFLEK